MAAFSHNAFSRNAFSPNAFSMTGATTGINLQVVFPTVTIAMGVPINKASKLSSVTTTCSRIYGDIVKETCFNGV